MRTQKREKQEKHFLFHLGRGGQFHNPGHKMFIGMFDSYDEAVSDIDSRRAMFEKDRDEKGRFCKKYYTDCSGNVVASYGDMTFDFDGLCDTFRIVQTSRLDRDDLALILIEGYSYLLTYLSDEEYENIKEELIEAFSLLSIDEQRKVHYEVIRRYQNSVVQDSIQL